MKNIFEIFNIFKSYIKIYPTENIVIGNRERSKTEYNYENYEDMLHSEFKRKMDYKRNKNISSLRIRGSSF